MPTRKPKNQSVECVEKFIKFTHKRKKYVPTYVWWIWYSLYYALFVLLMAWLIYYSYNHEHYSLPWIIQMIYTFFMVQHFTFLKVRNSYCIKKHYNNILHSYTTWYKWLHSHKIYLYKKPSMIIKESLSKRA